MSLSVAGERRLIKPACRQFVTSVLLAGLFAGLLLTVVQKMQVTPIIAQAEVYEDAQAAVNATASAAAMKMQAPQPAGANDDMQAMHHPAPDWEPANGTERTLYTVMANVTMAVGFALLMGAAILLRGAPVQGWREGLLWGLAGYLVVFVAPSLGLAPEVPGTLAAPLLDRQVWWVGTAVASAVALALLVFGRHPSLKVLALVLLVAPHLVGAPEPQIHGGAAPADLARAFIYATAIANCVFWLGLGGAFGYLNRKLAGAPGTI